MIYFVQAGEAGPIKVGYCRQDRSFESRMQTMQTNNHEQLHLLAHANGDVGLERKLHRALSTLHVRGEWYRFDPLLMKIVAAYQEDPDANIFHRDSDPQNPLQRRLPSKRTLQRRAAKAAFERALADGSMVVKTLDRGADDQ